MVVYTIWDDVEKSHHYNPDGGLLEFTEEYDAHVAIEDLFDSGLYPDRPSNVLKIDVYENGYFVKQIEYSPITPT